MKEIKAYIKPHKLSEVTMALRQVEHLSGMSVTNAIGFGRLVDEISDFIGHVKVEVVCRDEDVEPILELVRTAAHTGLAGDGKIYVFPVDDAIRISSGERGEKAV